MKVIVINSAKGGVGKTEVVELLAFGIKGNGFKVAVADLDVTTPNVSSDGLDVIKSDSTRVPTKSSILKFLRKVKRETKDYEYLVIDTPPTVSDIYFQISSVFKNAVWVFVTTPSKNAISDTRVGMTYFRSRGGKTLRSSAKHG